MKKKRAVKKAKKGPIVFGTGHRPDKLNGYGFEYNPLQQWVFSETRKFLVLKNPFLVYVGMALGFDTILAKACVAEQTPFIACIPFEGQEKVWPEQSIFEYHRLLKLSLEVVEVCEPGYAPWKMQKRNEYMVDKSDEGLSCYNGDEHGGTFNCLQYANRMKRPVTNIDPNVYMEMVSDAYDDDGSHVDDDDNGGIPF